MQNTKKTSVILKPQFSFCFLGYIGDDILPIYIAIKNHGIRIPFFLTISIQWKVFRTGVTLKEECVGPILANSQVNFPLFFQAKNGDTTE